MNFQFIKAMLQNAFPPISDIIPVASFIIFLIIMAVVFVKMYYVTLRRQEYRIERLAAAAKRGIDNADKQQSKKDNADKQQFKSMNL